MEKKNLKIISLISLILIVVTSLPYLYAWLSQPTNTFYLGNGLFNPHDNHVYYAYIEQAKAGHWLFYDVFTPEQHKPFLHIFWLIVGWLAKLFTLSPIWAFHLSRILLIPLFVFTIFKFLRRVWHNDPKQNLKTTLALILFFFSTSLGGWIALFGKVKIFYTTEAWWPEAYAFTSIYATPHFIASWILIVASLYFYLDGIQNKNYKKIILGGILGAVLTQFHTFYLALLIPLTLVFALVEVKKNQRIVLWQTLVYYSFFLPVIAYYFWMTITDMVMAKRLTENLMLTPGLFYVFSAFSLLFLCAIIGLVLFFQNQEKNIFKKLLIIWLIIVPFLLYSGLPFERRLVEGWQLPVVVLAIETLWIFYQKISFKKSFLILIIVLLASSSLFVFMLETFIPQQKTERRMYYLSTDVRQALLWLKQTDPDFSKIVLAAPLTGINATFLANKTIFLGHGLETLSANQKKEDWLNFINNNTNEAKKVDFLKKWKIDYLFWGPYEQMTEPQFKPAEKPYLHPIYQNAKVTIYQVITN